MPDESSVNCLPLEIAVFTWISSHMSSGSQWVPVLALPLTNHVTLRLSLGIEALVSTSERNVPFVSKTLKTLGVRFRSLHTTELQLVPLLRRSFQEGHKDSWRLPQGNSVLTNSLQDYETRWSFSVVMNLGLFVFICPLWGHPSANTDRMKLELMVSKHPGFWDIFRLLKKISTSC